MGGNARARSGCMVRAAVLVALAAAPGAAQAPVAPVPPAVAALVGVWEGSGTLMGRAAAFGMTWSVLPGGFARLSFDNGWAGPDGVTPVLHAEATYLFRGDSAVGVWVDDRPQRITLEAVATDSSVVTRWIAPTEQGRTEYVVRGDSAHVRDFVGAPGAERGFAEAVYRRLGTRAAPGTPEQRSALVDTILERTRAREAWSPPKEQALGYDPLQAMEAVRGEVVGARTEAELFYALVKMSNARRDSHLSVTPVEGGLRPPERAARRAPIDVLPDFTDVRSPAFFVSGVDPAFAGGAVAPGDRIVGVNDRTMPDYVATFSTWTRHSSTHGLVWDLAEKLPQHAPDTPPWLYRETLDLTLEKPSGQRYAVSLPYLDPDGVDVSPAEAELYPGFSTVLERFNFHVLRPDDGREVVLLRWLDFEYELIQDVVDLMEYAEREDLLDHALVIDVTASSGGSRGAYAIQRLVDRPFRTTFGNIRISDAGIDMIRAWATEPDDLEAPDILGLNESGSWLHEWARTDAMAAIERGDAYTPPVPFKLAHLPRDSDGILHPAPVHFRGPVAIIGGPSGGSHLDQFVAMFADNDLAFTIGMPTGGYSNTWEAEEVLRLPGTGQPLARFMWNVGHTLRPDGRILEGNPVQPDVYVPLTRDNFRTYHRDLLSAALARILRSIS